VPHLPCQTLDTPPSRPEVIDVQSNRVLADRPIDVDRLEIAGEGGPPSCSPTPMCWGLKRMS